MREVELDNAQKAQGLERPLVPVYKQKFVETFWQSTSEKTKRIVKDEAELDKEKLFSTKTRKKLSKKASQYLAGASATELDALLRMYLEHATDRHDGVLNSPSKVVHAERRTTRLLKNFHGYVEAYSGVIQLMDGAGPGYGSTAYGALSLFLVVAVNKQQTEDIIDSMLLNLQQQYRRIQMVKDVYATEDMKKYTAVVYRLGIEFLYEAVRYYSIGTFRRLAYSIKRPPSIQLTIKVAEIQAAIEEMQKEMELLDGIRLKAIDQRLENVAESVDGIEKNVHSLQARNDKERMTSLRRLLKLSEHQVNTPLREYDALLSRTFDGVPRLPPFDVHNDLFGNVTFRDWCKSSASSILLLHGSTDAPYQTDLSWISSAAVGVVNDAEEIFDDSPIVLRYFCRTTDSRGERPPKVSPVTLISSFLFQLLSSSKAKSIIQDEDKYEGLKHDIELLNDTDAKKATEKVARLYSLISVVMKEIDARRILLVLDRVDQIEGDRDRFLQPLLNLMKGSKGFRIKAFMTLRIRYVRSDESLVDLLEDGACAGLEFNQNP